MNMAAKLSVYGAALALIVTGAWVAGTAVGPPTSAATVPGGHGAVSGGAISGGAIAGAEDAEHEDAPIGAVTEAATDEPAGLASSRGGYTLTPSDTTPTAGAFSFTITGPDGRPVTGFDVEHDKRMHLIVVRRDTSGFQHVHPDMAADGTWSAPLTLPAAGSYRAFADFTPTGGAATTLGVDVATPGQFEPVMYEPSRTATVDGYTVELSGDLVPGTAAPLALSVSRDGVPVTDLQPYLAAYGHLVALREGDLAYLHVHPEDAATAGDAITFMAEYPSPGAYRLFLQFKHEGRVHTAAFTQEVAR